MESRVFGNGEMPLKRSTGEVSPLQRLGVTASFIGALVGEFMLNQ